MAVPEQDTRALGKSPGRLPGVTKAWWEHRALHGGGGKGGSGNAVMPSELSERRAREADEAGLPSARPAGRATLVICTRTEKAVAQVKDQFL